MIEIKYIRGLITRLERSKVWYDLTRVQSVKIELDRLKNNDNELMVC